MMAHAPLSSRSSGLIFRKTKKKSCGWKNRISRTRRMMPIQADNFQFVNLLFERGKILFSKGFFYSAPITSSWCDRGFVPERRLENFFWKIWNSLHPVWTPRHALDSVSPARQKQIYQTLSHSRLRSVYQFCGGICPAKNDKVHSAWPNRFKPGETIFRGLYSFFMQGQFRFDDRLSAPKINLSVNSFGGKNGI